MGRTVVAEERLEKYIQNLFTSETWSLGLIIGQQTNQRDYAVHMVRTPAQGDPEEEESPEEGAGSKKKQKKKVELNLSTVEDVWFLTHAKQVLKMLPGGLEIIGIFAMAPPTMMTSAQMRLKHFIYALHKMTSKASAWMKPEEEITDRILLQICPSTRKCTCRTFDVADNQGQSGAKPADWKYQSYLNRWITITTSVSMGITCQIPRDIGSQTLLKQIQHTLSAYCRGVWDSVVTLNNRVLPPDTMIDTPSGGDDGGGGGGGRRKGRKYEPREGVAKQFYAELYAPPRSNFKDDEVMVSESAGLMVMKGTMCCRAYLHNKATFREATQAIRRDVIRSLLSRSELLCEDLACQEEEQYPKVVLETPKRIFAAYGNSPLCFCDYTFPDEKLFESKERFRDLLELEVKDEQLETSCESLPTDEDLLEAETIPERPDLPLLPKSSIIRKSRGMLGVIIGSVVAALAAGVSYLYLGEEL